MCTSRLTAAHPSRGDFPAASYRAKQPELNSLILQSCRGRELLRTPAPVTIGGVGRFIPLQSFSRNTKSLDLERPAPMEVRLILVGGKANKNEVLLKLPTIVGRSPEAGLSIAHPMVSREHCEIFESAGMLRIRDLGSLNGTFIGQRQIIEAPLRPNDEFTVGPLTFRIAYEYAGEVTASGANGRRDDEGEAAAGPAVPAPPSDKAPPVVLSQRPMPEPFPGEVPVPDFGAWADASIRQAGEPPSLESVDLNSAELETDREPAKALESPGWAAEPVVWEEPPVVPAEDFLQATPTSEEIAEIAESAPEPKAHPSPDRPKKKGWWPFRRSKTKQRAGQPSSEPTDEFFRGLE